MSITHIDNIGIPKHKKHLRFLSSGTKLFYNLWVKRFFDIRREAQSFYADFSIWPPPPLRAAPVAHTFVWPRPGLNLNFFIRPANSTNWLFSNPPKSSAHASGAWRHSYPLAILLPGIFVLTYVNDTSSLLARQHLRSSLHLTKPCAKRKVLSLTKPKGRIYKTKSHSHYITIQLMTNMLLTPESFFNLIHYKCNR